MGTGLAPTASAGKGQPQSGRSCWERIPGVTEGPRRPHLENGTLQTGSGWPARRKDPGHKHGPPVATTTFPHHLPLERSLISAPSSRAGFELAAWDLSVAQRHGSTALGCVVSVRADGATSSLPRCDSSFQEGQAVWRCLQSPGGPLCPPLPGPPWAEGPVGLPKHRKPALRPARLAGWAGACRYTLIYSYCLLARCSLHGKYTRRFFMQD